MNSLHFLTFSEMCYNVHIYSMKITLVKRSIPFGLVSPALQYYINAIVIKEAPLKIINTEHQNSVIA